MDNHAVQLSIDGDTVPVLTRGGRACAAAAPEPCRLFEPAPVQMAGQGALGLEGVEDSAGCLGSSVPGTPS